MSIVSARLLLIVCCCCVMMDDGMWWCLEWMGISSLQPVDTIPLASACAIFPPPIHPIFSILLMLTTKHKIYLNLFLFIEFLRVQKSHSKALTLKTQLRGDTQHKHSVHQSELIHFNWENERERERTSETGEYHESTWQRWEVKRVVCYHQLNSYLSKSLLYECWQKSLDTIERAQLTITS